MVHRPHLTSHRLHALCAAEGKGKSGHIQLDILVEVSSRRVPCLLLPSAAVMCGCLLASLLPPPYPDAALCPGAAVASRSLAQHTQAMGRQNFGCDTGNWDWKGLTSQNVTLNGGWGFEWRGTIGCMFQLAQLSGARASWPGMGLQQQRHAGF